jgi:hypothetical protein
MKSPLAIALALVCALHCGGDVIITQNGDAATDANVFSDSAIETALDTHATGDSAGDATESTPDAATDIYAANCTSLQRCDPLDYNQLFTSMNDCLAFTTSYIANMYSLPGVTPDELAATLAALNNANCNAGGSFYVAGTLPNGAACIDAIQCASGQCSSNGLACGTCVGAAIGAACTTSYECAGNVYCVGGTCQPGLANGMPCDNTTPCQSSYCGPATSDAGTLGVYICQDPPPPPTEGAPCPQGVCAIGLYCNANSLCAQPVYVKAGQPCDFTTFCAGGYCDNNTNVCTAYLPPGSPCDANSGCRYQCALVNDGGLTGFCDVPWVTSCN